MEATGGGGGDDCRRRLGSPIMESAEETAVPCSVRKRKTTEPENQQEEEQQPEDQREEEEEDLPPGGGVIRACVIEGSKHADGSIYRQDTHFCHRLYRLDDTRETLLKPTNLSHPDTKNCRPNCRLHKGCAMMQIFSLKLANHSAINNPTGPIHLHGFMAVRDLLQPLRNYVFNCTRDNPLILYPCPDDPSSPLLIPMTGPKRGIYLQARALIEFDLRIKRSSAKEDDDDLQLNDGAATFSELTPFHGVYTQRIHGDHGAAVDISLALLRQAVEARIQISVPRIPAGGLCLSLACLVSGIRQEIKLFNGVVDKAGNLERSFVVAVVVRSPLILHFKVARAGGDMENNAVSH